MNLLPNSLKMVPPPDQLDHRSALKGLSRGAGAVVLHPFLNGLAAEAAELLRSKKVVFPKSLRQ